MIISNAYMWYVGSCQKKQELIVLTVSNQTRISRLPFYPGLHNIIDLLNWHAAMNYIQKNASSHGITKPRCHLIIWNYGRK